MNKEREAVYGLRGELVEGVDQKELILEDYGARLVGEALGRFAAKDAHADQWNVDGMRKYLLDYFGLDLAKKGIDPDQVERAELGDAIFAKLHEIYESKEKQLGADAMRYHERMIMLSVLDTLWKEHLLNMDHLKEGIGLRGYAQKDPLVEYKRESFDMFEAMMARFQEDTARYLFHMQIVEGGAPHPPVAGDHAEELPPPPPRRSAQTSVDDLEDQFHRRKKRQFQQALMPGATNGNTPPPVCRASTQLGP